MKKTQFLLTFLFIIALTGTSQAIADYKIFFSKEKTNIIIPETQESAESFDGIISQATYQGFHNSSNELYYGMDITLSPDGKNIYIISSNPDSVFQYTLETPWDISTANLHGQSTTSGFDGFPVALDFNDDGTKIFSSGGSTNRIAVHNLSTPWDVTTASFASSGAIDKNIVDSVSDIQFYNNGQNILISDYTTDMIYNFSVPVAWNPANMTLIGSSPSFNSQTPSLNGFHLLKDGKTLLITGQSSDTVFRYKLNTPWNISTAQYENDFFSVKTQEGNVGGVYLSTSASKFYVTGFGSGDIHEYLIP